MLAGVHEADSPFIAHDGLFNQVILRHQKMWFRQLGSGRPSYWEKGVQDKSYDQFNPMNYVANWDSPILDLSREVATTALPKTRLSRHSTQRKLRGIKSRFVYMPKRITGYLVVRTACFGNGNLPLWLDETMPSTMQYKPKGAKEE